MSKYISEACRECEVYVQPYGCTDHSCPIHRDYEQGMAEMAADFEVDRLRDARLDEELDK